MIGFIRLDTVKHCGAIACKVVDAQTQKPIERATAVIESGPVPFQRWLAIRQQQSKTQPGNRAITAIDGCCGFVDLPDGAYRVAVQGPPNLHYGVVKKDFTVHRDVTGTMAPSIVAIALPPTGATGKIQAKDLLTPLPLARVHLDSSEDVAYCDANGSFVVSGVCPGVRKVSIRATGFRSTTIATTITTGTIIDIGTILLVPKGP